MIDHQDLLIRLTLLPSETEWVEFKVDNDDPQEIGQQISALSNSARLHGNERAFLVWGVQDKTHHILGSTFQPRTKRVSGQELENWLCTQLKPQIHFWIREVDIDGKHCVLFEIEPAPTILSPSAERNGFVWVAIRSRCALTRKKKKRSGEPSSTNRSRRPWPPTICRRLMSRAI